MVVPSKILKTMKTPITVEQWGELEGPPHYDLVAGQLKEKPDVAIWHEILLIHLVRYLANYVHEHKIGILVSSKAKLKISKYHGREPDIFYIPKEMYRFIGKNLFTGVPPLVVEILSPSNEHEDRGDKFEEYAQLGIAQYWIIDFPQRRIEIYALRRETNGTATYELVETVDGDAVFRPAMFPGLEIPLNEVWPTEFENRTDE